jgi:glycosyltransferase involved in cell wall biosynthesis
MPNCKGRILFITEDLFIPARNGSARIYYKTAEDYKREGNEIFCIAAYRNVEETRAPDIKDGYLTLFSDVLFIPSVNYRGAPLAKLGLVLREVTRTLSGDVYSGTPLYSITLRPFVQSIIDFVEKNKIDVIYFHKPHTILMLRPLLHAFSSLQIIVEMHDDFVERAEQYRLTYRSLFSRMDWKNIVTRYLGEYVKLLRLSRLNVARSRCSEAALLHCSEKILVASEQEFDHYQRDPVMKGKVVYQPWQFDDEAAHAGHRTDAQFDAGFISGDDIMNLDGLVHFCTCVLPGIRARKPDFRFLIAGAISTKALGLVGHLPNVTMWGPVDDVCQFYDAVSVVIIPVRYGTGVSIKALEAIRSGCRVVSTSKGVRGIPRGNLGGIVIADGADQFGDSLLTALH